MKNGPRTFCLSLAVISAALLVSPNLTSAQNLSWDTSFIPEDSFFFTGLNVEGLIRLEEEDSELLERLKSVFAAEAKFKVEELRQVQFVMGGKDLVSLGDSLEVKMLFKQPQDWKALIDKMFSGYELKEVERDGTKYFTSKYAYSPSVYIVNDLMMVVAKEERLKELMKNESGKGSIVDMVSEAEGNAHMFIAFEYNDQLDEFMREATAELQGLPFNLGDIAAEAKNGTATVMLDANDPFIANIKTKNAEGAERLKRAADAVIALGKIGVPQGRKMIETFPDFGDARIVESRKEFLGSAKKGLDVAEVALDNTTVNANENGVEIKTEVDGGAVDAARSIAKMMLFGMEMRSQALEDSWRTIEDDFSDAPQEIDE